MRKSLYLLVVLVFCGTGAVAIADLGDNNQSSNATKQSVQSPPAKDVQESDELFPASGCSKSTMNQMCCPSFKECRKSKSIDLCRMAYEGCCKSHCHGKCPYPASTC